MAAALEMALPVLLFIGLPCKWAVISFLGKNALLLKLELMVLCLICTMPLSSSPKHALFGMIDTMQVLVSQCRAAEGLLSMLLVTLQNFALQISTDWLSFIPLEPG